MTNDHNFFRWPKCHRPSKLYSKPVTTSSLRSFGWVWHSDQRRTKQIKILNINTHTAMPALVAVAHYWDIPYVTILPYLPDVLPPSANDAEIDFTPSLDELVLSVSQLLFHNFHWQTMGVVSTTSGMCNNFNNYLVRNQSFLLQRIVRHFTYMPEAPRSAWLRDLLELKMLTRIVIVCLATETSTFQDLVDFLRLANSAGMSYPDYFFIHLQPWDEKTANSTYIDEALNQQLRSVIKVSLYRVYYLLVKYHFFPHKICVKKSNYHLRLVF